jgi:hypothetical protein
MFEQVHRLKDELVDTRTRHGAQDGTHNVYTQEAAAGPRNGDAAPPREKSKQPGSEIPGRIESRLGQRGND